MNTFLRDARKSLAARPAGFDYREQMVQRLARSQTHMLAMGQLGGMASLERKPYEIQDRVAKIYITGVLANECCWWDETGYQDIRDEVNYALNDADVDGILLSINSPGGETDNLFETADFLAAAATRKPIWAVVDPMAYSAAYALASQASKVYVPPITGGVGSIGVFCMHMDYSKMLESAGITATLISAGAGKTDGHPFVPLSAAAQKTAQAEVDRLYAEFVSRVASGRRLAKSAIITLGAALFEGAKAAMKAGLADRTGSCETAWMDLGGHVAKSNRTAAAAALVKPLKGESLMEQPKTATPGTEAAAVVVLPPPDLDAIRALARSDGHADAIAVVELCTIAGEPGLAAGFIREKKTAAEVSKFLLDKRATASEKDQITNGVLPHQAADANKPKESIKDRIVARLKREGKVA